jgi:hypothetical protein
LLQKNSKERENFQMEKFSKDNVKGTFVQKKFVKTSKSEIQHSNHFIGRRNPEDLDEKKSKSPPVTRRENSEEQKISKKINFGKWGAIPKNKVETVKSTVNEAPRRNHFEKKINKKDPESEDEQDNDSEFQEFENFLTEETQTLFIAFKTREEAKQVQDLCNSHVDKSAILKIRHLKIDKHQIPKEVLKQVERQVEREIQLTGDTVIDFLTRQSEINAKLTKLGYKY